MAKLQGKVVAISDSGVAVTDISADRLSDVPSDESVTIACEGHTTHRIFSADHDQPEMTLLAMVGRSGFLEITLVGDSVNTFLGIGVGSEVQVSW